MNHSQAEPEHDWLEGFRLRLTYCLFGIVLLGVVLNTAVFLFLVRIVQRQKSLTPAWVLSAMCLADIACLISLGTYSVLGRIFFSWPESRNYLKTTFCKLNLFVTHTASAFSIWCWVVLSFLRYIALFHPLIYANHSRIRQPSYILQGTGVVCMALQIWILVTVQFDDSKNLSCSVHHDIPKLIIKGLHVFEISWTYYIPIVLIATMDVIVLVRSYKSNQASSFLNQSSSFSTRESACPRTLSPEATSFRSSTRSTTSVSTGARNRRQQRHLLLLKRYLLLMSFDLLMNLPSCTIRLIGAVDPQVYGNPFVDEVLPGVAYVLYYSQFCINVLYLWVLLGRWDNRAAKSTAPNNRSPSTFLLPKGETLATPV